MKIKKPNYYFDIKNKGLIIDLDQIINLTRGALYTPQGDVYNKSFVKDLHVPTYTEYGLFRGQISDWPLVPISYRDIIIDPNLKGRTFDHLGETVFYRNNRRFYNFREHCLNQIIDFPREFINQLIIAQHYGVPSPLLDWTESVWVALFFGINPKFKKEAPGFHDFYLYHLPNSNAIKRIEHYYRDLFNLNEILLLKPFPIDNRIERQRSYLTFHPHPNLIENKIEVHKYKISGKLVNEILIMFRSIGISTERLFPDYSGIVRKIMSQNDFIF